MRLRDLQVGDPCRIRLADLVLPSAGWELPPDPNATAFVVLHFWYSDGRACITARFGEVVLNINQPGDTQVQPCA